MRYQLDAHSGARGAKTEAPLRALLTESLQHTTQTRRVAAKRIITHAEWKPAMEEAWIAVKDLVRNRILLYHRKPGYRVLVFPDASDLFWGSCVTQVPSGELERDVEDMSHEPLGFINGAFKGSQLR